MTREELANATGLSYSLLTNMANDRRDPDTKTVEAICSALPQPLAADLLIALWCDMCPEKLRSLVHFIPAHRSDSLVEASPPPYAIAEKADAELEEAIRKARAAAIKYPQWRTALIGWTKTILE